MDIQALHLNEKTLQIIPRLRINIEIHDEKKTKKIQDSNDILMLLTTANQSSNKEVKSILMELMKSFSNDQLIFLHATASTLDTSGFLENIIENIIKNASHNNIPYFTKKILKPEKKSNTSLDIKKSIIYRGHHVLTSPEKKITEV